MRASGIEALLLNAGIGNRSEIIAAARREGLEVHIWKFTLMQSGHQDAHPEWYAVSRKGVSTAQQPPYVAYYKFMCPTRQPVRRQLEKQFRELARLKGVAGACVVLEALDDDAKRHINESTLLSFLGEMDVEEVQRWRDGIFRLMKRWNLEPSHLTPPTQD